MVKIVINSVAELKIFQSKIRALKNTLPQLQKIAFEKSNNDILLNAIKTEMSANDFSDKIINTTFIGKIEQNEGKLKAHVISEFQSDTGFDVANAREEGTTQPNPIRPKSPDGALKIPVGEGGFIFRKSSRPSGMPRLLIIERNIKKFKNLVTDNYNSNLADAISKFLGGT